MNHYDLIVIGAGSGGMGAALTAARLGLRTLWLDKESAPGGTGVHSLVNVWQPAVSVSPLARELAEKLVARGQAHYTAPDCDTPSGRPLHRRVAAGYDDSLVRWADRSRGLIGPALTYDPGGMSALLTELATETPGLELWTETVCLQAHTAPGAEGRRAITGLTVERAGQAEHVTAGWYVDATADLAVATSAGCAVAWGRESREAYDEPSASEEHEFKLNGWTLCCECHPGPDRIELPREGWGGAGDWAHISELPGGGYNVNLVFQLSGEAGWRLGPEQAREYLLRNLARRWPGVRAAYGLDGYGLTRLAARVGVREGPRLVGQYVLTEQDFRLGNRGRHHPDCIAFTDHALDRHSPDGGCREAESGAVGIPFRCLQPREVGNLLVACRGASFSSLAASAARLQRTMIELGEAAARFLATGRVVQPEEGD